MSPGTLGTSEGSPYYPPRAAQQTWWRRRLDRLERSLAMLPPWVPRLRDPEVAAAASVVPGLGHLLVEGRWGKPTALFCSYAAIFLWTQLFSGLRVWVGAFALFSFHQWVLSDSAARARARLGLPRLSGWALARYSVACAFFLGLVYRQAGVFVAGYGSAVCLTTRDFEPRLNAGDRLLVLNRASYQRGDIVYSKAHGGLERVVGRPGDQIVVQGNALLVNGAPPLPGQGTLSGALFAQLAGADMVVPEGSYCVFFPARVNYLGGNRLLTYFMIPARELDGKVALRYHPEYKEFP